MTKVPCNCTNDPFHSKAKTVDPTQLEYKINNLIGCILDDVFEYDFWTLLPVTEDTKCYGCIYVGNTDANGVVLHL